MTTKTVRKFAINDTVLIADNWSYGTVVGFIDEDSVDERVRDAVGTGPLYLVNEGNVFADRYEIVFAESELATWPDDCPVCHGNTGKLNACTNCNPF